MLKRKGVPHNVLNAKQHKSEAEIVARAGQKGAVTIATNMAGRGTDIKLGDGHGGAGGRLAAGRVSPRRRRRQNPPVPPLLRGDHHRLPAAFLPNLPADPDGWELWATEPLDVRAQPRLLRSTTLA